MYKYKRSNIKKEINKQKEQIPPSGENSKTLVKKTDHKRLYLSTKLIPIKSTLTEDGVTRDYLHLYSLLQIKTVLEIYFKPRMRTEIFPLIIRFVNLTGHTYQFILTYEPPLGGTPLDEAYKGKYKKYVPFLSQKANEDNSNIISKKEIGKIEIKKNTYRFLSLLNVVVCQENDSELYGAYYIIPNPGDSQANEYCSMTMPYWPNGTEREICCFCTYYPNSCNFIYFEIYKCVFDLIKNEYRYDYKSKVLYYLDIENKEWERQGPIVRITMYPRTNTTITST